MQCSVDVQRRRSWTINTQATHAPAELRSIRRQQTATFEGSNE